MSYPGDPALASDVQQRILTTFQQTLELAGQGNRQEALLGCDFILRLDPQFGPARTLQQMINAGRLRAGARRALRRSGVAPPARGDAAAQARAEAEPYVQTFLDFGPAGASPRATRPKPTGLLRKARSLDAGHPEIAALRGRALPRRSADEPSFDLPDVDFLSESSRPVVRERVDVRRARRDGRERRPDPGAPGAKGSGPSIAANIQGAIDAWSRIFLIDIDHHEAARRIEEARRLKAEREREVEELFHGGVAQFDSGPVRPTPSARSSACSSSRPATSWRRNISRRSPSAGAAAGGSAAAGTVRAAERCREKGRRRRGAPVAGQVAGRDPGAARTGRPRGASRRTRSARVTVSRPRSAAGRSPRFLLIGGVRAGAARGRRLAAAPATARASSRTPRRPATGPQRPRRPIRSRAPRRFTPRARRRSRSPSSGGCRRRIRAYAEAQSLVSQWEALVKPAEPVPAGLAPEIRAKRDGLLAAAERACREGENLRCRRLLDQAQPRSCRSMPALTTQARDGGREPGAARPELKMFADGEFEDSLNRLWRTARGRARQPRRQAADRRHLLQPRRARASARRPGGGGRQVPRGEARSTSPTSSRTSRELLARLHRARRRPSVPDLRPQPGH